MVTVQRYKEAFQQPHQHTHIHAILKLKQQNTLSLRERNVDPYLPTLKAKTECGQTQNEDNIFLTVTLLLAHL